MDAYDFLFLFIQRECGDCVIHIFLFEPKVLLTSPGGDLTIGGVEGLDNLGLFTMLQQN